MLTSPTVFTPISKVVPKHRPAAAYNDGLRDATRGAGEYGIGGDPNERVLRGGECGARVLREDLISQTRAEYPFECCAVHLIICNRPEISHPRKTLPEIVPHHDRNPCGGS